MPLALHSLRRVFGLLGIAPIAISPPAQAQFDPLFRGLMQAIPQMTQPAPQPYPPPYPPQQYAPQRVYPPPSYGAQPYRSPAYAEPPPRARTGLPGPARAQGPFSDPSGPSFSCVRARTPSEQAICAQPELAALDRELASSYAAAQSAAGSSGPNAETVTAQQSAWRLRRDRCGSNVVCLRRAMTDRIAELASPWPDLTGGSPAAGGPVALGGGGLGAGVPGAGTPEAGGADPLEPLVHPPAGLRPWPFDLVGGRFEVSWQSHQRWVNSAESALGSRFFHLLALTSLPGAFEAEADTGFLSGLLDEAASTTIFGSGPPGSANRWGGRNEFEAAKSRQAFLDQYVPRIKALVPGAPFLLRWSEPAVMGQYDSSRGGFPVRALGIGDSRLSLYGSVQSGGLVLAPGTTPLPDLFWTIDARRAEAFVQRHPNREVELAAEVVVGAIDPVSREVPLSLKTLSLREPRNSQPLFTYPVAAAADALVASRPAPMGAGSLPPQPGGDATANGAEAARRWHLPVRAGLPWIDVTGSAALAADQPGNFAPNVDRQPGLNSAELWSRAIHAMALATLPDASAIQDADVPRLSCTFLPPARQLQLFRQTGCSAPQGRPDSPFILKDGAAAFRSADLPQIVAGAPVLPLRLLLVDTASLGTYDTARGGFPIRTTALAGPTPFRLFGSQADVIVPEFWRATESEARRYAAAQSGQYGSKAWMAVTVTITGTTPGQGTVAIGDGGTGLPNRSGWRFHTDRVALYLDAGLGTVLHDFTPELVRIPQPLIGTEQERAPSRPREIPLDDETALLLMLRRAPAPTDGPNINWAEAAAARYRFERDQGQQTARRALDPWGPLFATAPDASGVEAYRAWTVRRAAALPDTVVLRRMFNGGNSGRVLQNLPVLGRSSLFLNNPRNYTPPSGDFERQLKAAGIEQSQILPVALTVLGSSSVPVYAAVPRPVDSYVVPEVRFPPQEDGNSVLDLRAQVVGTDLMTAAGRFAVLVKLIPISAEARNGGAVLMSAPLPGPDWDAAVTMRTASAEAAAQQKAAEERSRDDAKKAAASADEASVRAVADKAMAGTPYGPDIVGLRLGMAMSDAETLVRGLMPVARVLTATAANPRDQQREVGAVRIFVNTDRTEQIALLDLGTGKVLGVERTVVMSDAIGNAALIETLRAKYGVPSEDNTLQGKWQWGRTNRPPCMVLSTATPKVTIAEGMPAGNQWAQDMLVDMEAGLTTSWANAGQAVPSFTELKVCEPKVEVWRTNPTRMHETLYDARIYGVVAANRSAETKTTAAVPKL